MNIKIIFYGLGYNEFYQANVKIYDQNKNLIINKNTYNNKIEINLKKNKIYHLIAKTCNKTISTYIYTNNNIFIFNFQNNRRIITFSLRDYFYNLPIERGYLILWQRQ